MSELASLSLSVCQWSLSATVLVPVPLAVPVRLPGLVLSPGPAGRPAAGRHDRASAPVAGRVAPHTGTALAHTLAHKQLEVVKVHWQCRPAGVQVQLMT